MPNNTNTKDASFPVKLQGTGDKARLVATNLKKDSFYSVKAGTTDVTMNTKQDGVRKVGDPATKKLKSDSKGRIEFTYWTYTGSFFGSVGQVGVMLTNVNLTLVGPDNEPIKAQNPPPKPSPPPNPPPPVRGGSTSTPPTPIRPQTGNQNQPTPSQVGPPAPVTLTGNMGKAVDEGWSTTKPDVPATSISSRVLSSIERTVETKSETKTYNGGTPLSETSLYFDYIQTFYIDPAAVNNSQTVSLTEILLYFKQRPKRTNNQSNIEDPGVRICICEVVNGAPNLKKVYRESFVKLEYDEIITSDDADEPTIASFKSPFTLRTGNVYGIVINFEDPQYSLWVAKRGSNIVGTETPLTAGYTTGQLFRASNYLEIDDNPNTLDVLYRPETDTDLKFQVNVLKYDNSKSRTIELINGDYEFLEVTNITTGSISNFIMDEDLYLFFGNTQANVSYYRTGNVSVTENRTRVVGTGTKFLSELKPFDDVVITDGTDQNTDLRSVISITSDTIMTVSSPLNFTGTSAKVIKTIKGTLDFTHPSTGLFILSDSTADEDLRFINDGINDIAFTVATGYSNGDYVVFSQTGATPGKATITTNQTGYVTHLNILDPGYGFVVNSSSSPVATVYKSDGTLRTPSTITITATPGARIKGDVSGAVASISNVVAFSVDHIIPHLEIKTAGAVAAQPQFNFAYLNPTTNTYDINQNNYASLTGGTIIDTINYDATILSRSLELLNSSSLTISEGKSGIIKFDISSINPYESPELHVDLSNIFIFSNEINSTEEAINEHLPVGGNAVTRHITSKISFANYAEDIRTIASIYRPPGTDVQIYARLYNSKDTDAFDDKYWTPLVEKDSTFGTRRSSSTNKNDLIEITFGLPQYPPIVETLSGSVKVYSAVGNTTVDGEGTSFDTKLTEGDVVVLYDTNQPSTHAVVLVTSVTSATSFEMNEALENNSLADATLRVGLLSNSSVNYQYTAFNNIRNDNVARYYCASKTVQDTYNTLAMKIVLTSDKKYLVPRVDDIRVIGVSA